MVVMLLLKLFVGVAFLLTSTNAFLVRPRTLFTAANKLYDPPVSLPLVTRIYSHHYHHDPLSDMEAMIIMNVADFCVRGDECSLEDTEALIASLQEQEHANHKHHHMNFALNTMLQRLRHSRDSTPASEQHVKALIQSMERTADMEVC